MTISAIALFCEDIREEKSGMHTLIGIMPDNVSVSRPSGKSLDDAPIAKLCVYLRIHFAPTDEVIAGTARILTPDGNAIDLGDITQDIIEQAKAAATRLGNPTAGLLTRAKLPHFSLNTLGTFTVEVTLGSGRYVAGYVNFQHPQKEAATSLPTVT